MKLLWLPLGGPLPDAASSWKNALTAGVDWEAPLRGAELETAARAVWRGLPFVMAGRPEALDEQLDSLDADSAEVLADCAYFWLLTETSDYNHERLPQDRMLVLDWNSPSQHIVTGALAKLEMFPRLKGLSRSTQIVRVRLESLATGETGPGCSVLILGPTGSGKEEVAQSLVAGSRRRKAGMQCLGGAWLKMEEGMALTELLGLVRGRTEERIPGLLKQLSDMAMFIDDFETAKPNVQEAMLRIMSVPEGAPASYRPVGGQEDWVTNVWPIFATNSDIESFARQDFLFRFGARIICLMPLAERPADFPAIAHHLWEQIWKAGDKRKEPLRSDTIKHLFGKELNWDGNVRALASLLRLVASEMRNTAMNCWSQMEIIDIITARGPRYLDWVTAYGRRAATPAPAPDQPETTNLHPRSGLASRHGVSSEQELKGQLERVLSPRGVQLLGELEKGLKARTRDGKPVNDPGRHLFYAALLYMARKPSREATSTDLKMALGVGAGQVQKLCAAMVGIFTGPLADLCECRGGGQVRFLFVLPEAVLRNRESASA